MPLTAHLLSASPEQLVCVGPLHVLVVPVSLGLYYWATAQMEPTGLEPTGLGLHSKACDGPGCLPGTGALRVAAGLGAAGLGALGPGAGCAAACLPEASCFNGRRIDGQGY